MMEWCFVLLFAVPATMLVVHEDWLCRNSPKFALGCTLAALSVTAALLLVILWDY